jgi:hypothetical protein
MTYTGSFQKDPPLLIACIHKNTRQISLSLISMDTGVSEECQANFKSTVELGYNVMKGTE